MSALLLAALLAVGPEAPADPLFQTVVLTWDARAKTCGARINTAEFPDISGDAGRTALVAALPDKSRIVRLSRTTEMPYKCVSDVVTLLQHEGYRMKIGFSADSVAGQ